MILTCTPRPVSEEQSFQQMVLGKLDIHMPKNKFEPLPNTINLKKLSLNGSKNHT